MSDKTQKEGHRYRSTLKAAIKFIALGILTGSLLWLSPSHSFSVDSPTQFTVIEQPDSPLLIRPTFMDPSHAQSPRYGYSLTNNSGKPIGAYAVRELVRFGPGSPITSTSLVHFPGQKAFLAPQQSRYEEGGVGKTYEQVPIEINLSMDFVEFADGTTWGKDIGRSGEKLDGQRAGGRAA